MADVGENKRKRGLVPSIPGKSTKQGEEDRGEVEREDSRVSEKKNLVLI